MSLVLQAPADVLNLKCSSSLEQIEESNSEATGSECMSKLENTLTATTDDPTTLIKTVFNFKLSCIKIKCLNITCTRLYNLA